MCSSDLGRTEFAGHTDDPVICDHRFTVLNRKALQHRENALARAAAFCQHRLGLKNTHAIFVKEAVEKPFAGKRRVNQFVIFNRVDQHARFNPRIVFAGL